LIGLVLVGLCELGVVDGDLFDYIKIVVKFVIVLVVVVVVEM